PPPRLSRDRPRRAPDHPQRRRPPPHDQPPASIGRSPVPPRPAARLLARGVLPSTPPSSAAASSASASSTRTSSSHAASAAPPRAGATPTAASSSLDTAAVGSREFGLRLLDVHPVFARRVGSTAACGRNAHRGLVFPRHRHRRSREFRSPPTHTSSSCAALAVPPRTGATPTAAAPSP
ncbi:splicing factor, proline- and glutamine-rich-like, partial [Ananas comosus]|uniref:Splicing factor, proline- and glutamine-rich-like n=1 Tax=Ananas comosus TaxID=4615 RepID=A0A6P5EZP7_ANACO